MAGPIQRDHEGWYNHHCLVQWLSAFLKFLNDRNNLGLLLEMEHSKVMLGNLLHSEL